jgi:hypothetical protein
MLKIEAKNMLILAVLSVLLSCGLVSGLDWYNTEKSVAIAIGEGDVLAWNNFQTMNMEWYKNGFTKTSEFGLNYLGANQVSIDKSSSLTVLGADGSTKTYGNTLTQDLKFAGDQDLLSIGGLYTLGNDGKTTTTTTMLSFTNPKTGKTFNMASVDPDDPTKFVEEFISAMDLGISYERIQGLESHIGIVDSEEVTTNGMEFEYSLGKNTWVDA